MLGTSSLSAVSPDCKARVSSKLEIISLERVLDLARLASLKCW